ncbi:MAG: hypothetical protein FWD26_08820 [Treponema sp.]|nr:hypothetical protein [Treponema sp.]
MIEKLFKKALFLTVFLSLAISSFAGELPNRRVFIEGTASRQDHLEFFYSNFRAEAFGIGYSVAANRRDAGYIFRFNVQPNPANTNEFVIKISLIRNSDNFEILTFDFFFSSLFEMYEYNQFLFFRAVSVIPPLSESDLVVVQEVQEVVVQEVRVVQTTSQIDNRWKNKWLYFRASFDYPITFYVLQSEGLYNGIAVYDGLFESPDRFSPIDHKILAMPGATVGMEFQFFNFMSLELNVQASMGDTRSNTFINLAAGAELKFPLKFFQNVVLTPYAAFTYPLLVSDVFRDFPIYSVGGGIQIGIRGGKSGSFFIDISGMYSLTEAAMHNPFGELYRKPEVIHYKRFVVGLGIGYKIGVFNRPSREPYNPDSDPDNHFFSF